MQICSQCGATNRDNARFCSKCRTEFVSRSTVIPSGPLVAGALLQGRYQIIRVLGEGGFGAAYLTTDTRLKRACVAKQMLIPPGTSQASLDELKRVFEREADALVSLNQPGHPNIPEIYDFFSDASGNFLVMKYIEGESLEQRMIRLRGQMPGKDALDLALQVLDALVYLHSRSPAPVIHRDVKPANILVDTTGRAWLVDFGLSKAQPTVGGRTGLSEPMGTPGYAPPEQYKSGGAQPRSDVFALAATLYQMLTGDDPSKHPLTFPMLGTLPADLKAIVGQALDLDPIKRPTAVQWKVQLEALARPATTPAFRWDDGTVSKYPADLAAAADAHWDLARGYFTSGKWDKWFGDLHRNDLIAQVAQAKAQHPNADVALDSFLRAVSPAYPPSALQLSATNLDIGAVPWQAQRSLDLEVINTGSGCLHGRLAGLPAWLQASPPEFATHTRQTLKLTASTGGLTPRSQPYPAQLAVDAGTGGQALVTVSLAVPEPQLALDKTVVDLGSAYQGEAIRGSLTISNRGGSAFEAEVTCDATWATVSPSRLRVEAGKSKEVQMTAGTALMRMGRHSATLAVKVTSGGWSQAGAARVTANLPWFKTFWRRWAPTLDWAAVGMLVAVAWFGLIRIPIVRAATRQFLDYKHGEVASYIGLLVLLIVGGWLGILINRSRATDRLARIGCLASLLAPLLPWVDHFPAALAGSALTAVGVGLGLWADLGVGLTASLALCGVIGAVWLGVLHRTRPGQRQRRAAGVVAVMVFAVALVGIAYLGMQPRYGWRQIRALNIEDGYQMTVAPDGQMVVEGKYETVRLWRVADGALLRTLTGHTILVSSLAFASDGQMVAASRYDGTVDLWRVADGALLRTLPGPESSSGSLAFASDGQIVATGGADRTVRLWRVADGTLMRTLPPQEFSVNSLAFAPDGQILAAGEYRAIRLWRVADGALLRTLAGPPVEVTRLAFAPDGQTLSSWARYDLVRLWRVADGALLRTLTGPKSQVDSLVFAPDGQRVATGDSDGMVWLWRASDGALLRTFMGHKPYVRGLAFTPDGAKLVSGSGDGIVRVWQVGN